MYCCGWFKIYRINKTFKMAIIGAVFARGGSKGIPKKNLCKIAGLSLAKMALKSLIDSNLCKDIYLCSDTDEILEEALNLPVIRFKRDLNNCKDESSELDAWLELSKYLKNIRCFNNEDLLLIAPCTSPLRKTKTLINLVNKLKNNKDADGAICIKESNLLPDFNLLRKNDKEFLNTYLKCKRKINRQSAAKAWEMTTVAYCYKLGSILKDKEIFDLNTIGLDVKFPESLDIDVPEDLDLARKLYLNE